MYDPQSIIYDIEAEEATIGSVIEGGRPALDEARMILADSGVDFYQEKLRIVWETMIKLDDEKKPLDLTVINSEIKGKMGIDAGYLVQITYKGNQYKVKSYAEIVRSKSILRLTLTIMESAKQKLGNGENPEEVLGEILTQGSNLLASKEKNDAEPVKKTALKVFEEIEKRYQSQKPFVGIPTGLTDFDVLTGGIRGITILAGRPSAGKTTMALTVALNNSEENPVAIFSLEMDRYELTEKMISSLSGVDSYRIENGAMMMDSDWPRLSHAVGKIYEKNIYIDDLSDMKASQICVRARRMITLFGIKYIIIDYLQLIDPEKEIGNRNAELAVSLRHLKKLNRETGIPILLLSQLNRAVESRADKKPKMSDLRDCGAAEQDAHIVSMLYDEDEDNEEDRPVKIINNFVPKNRKGRKGKTLHHKFTPAISKFESGEF